MRLHAIQIDALPRRMRIQPMLAIIIWALVIAVVVFFKLTTREERSKMIETYWIIMLALGAFGFLLQFLMYGSISF